MTDVRREKKLLVRFALVQILAVAQTAAVQTGVNDYLVETVGQRFELPVGHAEAPLLAVVGASNRPLGRNGPVEGGGSGRYLSNLERQVQAQRPQGLPDPWTGDAAADRIDPARQVVDGLADARFNQGAPL